MEFRKERNEKVTEDREVVWWYVKYKISIPRTQNEILIRVLYGTVTRHCEEFVEKSKQYNIYLWGMIGTWICALFLRYLFFNSLQQLLLG
jgi:hypothetical protein